MPRVPTDIVDAIKALTAKAKAEPGCNSIVVIAMGDGDPEIEPGLAAAIGIDIAREGCVSVMEGALAMGAPVLTRRLKQATVGSWVIEQTDGAAADTTCTRRDILQALLDHERGFVTLLCRTCSLERCQIDCDLPVRDRATLERAEFSFGRATLICEFDEAQSFHRARVEARPGAASPVEIARAVHSMQRPERAATSRAYGSTRTAPQATC